MGGFKPSRKLLILQAMEQDRKRKEELERKHRGYDSLVKTSYTGIKEDENEAKPETGRKKLLGEQPWRKTDLKNWSDAIRKRPKRKTAGETEPEDIERRKAYERDMVNLEDEE